MPAPLHYPLDLPRALTRAPPGRGQTFPPTGEFLQLANEAEPAAFFPYGGEGARNMETSAAIKRRGKRHDLDPFK